MGDVLAFIVEMIFRVIFEAIVEGIFYGIKRACLALTGKSRVSDRRLEVMARHEEAKRQRRLEANALRRKHGRPEKTYQ